MFSLMFKDHYLSLTLTHTFTNTHTHTHTRSAASAKKTGVVFYWSFFFVVTNIPTILCECFCGYANKKLWLDEQITTHEVYCADVRQIKASEWEKIKT